MTRLEPLDWLRGLLALSIMVYHLTSWELYHPDSSELLGRLGVYGVSMFFVLSGLSMAATYSTFVKDCRSAAYFLLRRIFRIWPLLWIAVATVTMGGVVFKGQTVDYHLILLNITTLFGFIAPGSYINTGAWSIGNEMVYYALTPVILAAYDRATRYGNLILATSLVAGVYFGYWVLRPELTLANQWPTYINPFNNLFLYISGVALYYNAGRAELSWQATAAALLGPIAVFVWYPVSGDLIHLVTGGERIVFSAASVGLVFAFYKITYMPVAWISRPLVELGIATYGVYLLHPIIYSFVVLIGRKLQIASYPFLNIGVCMALTILVAIVLYNRVEAPFIRIGKRLTVTPRLVPLKG